MSIHSPSRQLDVYQRVRIARCSRLGAPCGSMAATKSRYAAIHRLSGTVNFREKQTAWGLPAASDQKPEINGFWDGRWHDGDSGKTIERAGQFTSGSLYFDNACGALVEALGFLKLHFGAGAVAGLLGWVLEGCAAGAKELFHTVCFVAVFSNRHDCLAGAQAAIHFAVNTAGVRGRGLEIFFTAADLEEIE